MKLNDLMKMFGLAAKEEKADVDLKDTEELKQLMAAFEDKETQLIEALDQIDDLKKQMEQFADAKAKAEQTAKDVAVKAHQDKMANRLVEMSAEFGDERATRLLALTEKMDDAEYREVFGVNKTKAEAEEASFKESGVDASVKEEKKPVHFKTFIKKQGK